MVTKVYQLHDVLPNLPILQKGRTTIEWTWWRPRNANSKDCSPQRFLANSLPVGKQMLTPANKFAAPHKDAYILT